MHTSSLSSERNYGIYRVIFIGAGFSGTLAALEYAKYKDAGNVLIVDENEEPVGKLSSSYNQCYKLHIGHHYIGDLATAEQCLLDSIYFARNYPAAINGDLK
ncbi:MAG: hypothetical protein JSS53_09825, partial [Proteobacteria bacterium]|nr:hypothetical protein [Pseudomonadota bacterium]